MVKLQPRDLVVIQQKAKIKICVIDLITMTNIEWVDSDNSYNHMEPEKYVLVRRWWIRAENVIAHVEDQGSWVRDLFQSLLEFDRNEVVVQVGQFNCY